MIVALTATSFAKEPRQKRRTSTWHKHERKILKKRATYGISHVCSISPKRNAWYQKHVKMQKQKEMWRKSAKNKRKKNKKSRF